VIEVIDGTRQWALLHGDSTIAMSQAPDGTFHAAVMDPPSGIEMFGKAWDANKGGRDQWVAWLRGIMEQVWRALRPGGWIVVWALPRTSHWTATAIEDAGFEIRDRIHDLAAADEALAQFAGSLDPNQRDALGRLVETQASPILYHLFGNGMLKGVNVSKSLDKAAGVKPISVEPATLGVAGNADWNELKTRHIMPPPTSPEAKRWAGWYSGMRPGAEHWILARKPFKGSLIKNVVAQGTGALNLKGAGGGKRIPNHLTLRHAPGCAASGVAQVKSGTATAGDAKPDQLFGDGYAARPPGPRGFGKEEITTWVCVAGCPIAAIDTQSGGGASRFFPNVGPVLYCAKASRREKNLGCEELVPLDWRQGAKNCTPRSGQIYDAVGRKGAPRPNSHPTTKPLHLMRWLLRLVAQPGALILDPFAGSGTTGVAALQEKMRFVGIELNDTPEMPYATIARARLEHESPAPVETSAMFRGFD